MEHPHLHTIIPAGGWNETTQYWKASKKKFFIPVKVISAVFKGKFLWLLKQAYRDNELKFEGEIKPLQLKCNFKRWVNELYDKKWVVYAKKPFRNAVHIIQYLGRYSHRVAISNHRIEGIEGDKIAFKWKNYQDHGKQKTMRIPAQEFIRRFLLHVLPKGFCKIRYYGIFSSRNRKDVLLKCRKAMGYKVSKPKFAGLSWQEVLQLISGIDVSVCPACKSGKMKVFTDLKGYRGPPYLTKPSAAL